MLLYRIFILYTLSIFLQLCCNIYKYDQLGAIAPAAFHLGGAGAMCPFIKFCCGTTDYDMLYIIFHQASVTHLNATLVEMCFS